MKLHFVFVGVVLGWCAVGGAEKVESKRAEPITVADSLQQQQAARDALRHDPAERGPVDSDATGMAADPLELADKSYRLPEGTPNHILYYRMGAGAAASDAVASHNGAPPEGFDTPIYVNEPPPTIVFPPGPGRRIADDLFTVAAGGCAMSGYEFVVGRSANWCSFTGQGCETDDDCSGSQTCVPRPDQGFTADFAMYDGCPGLGGQIIPGTEGSLTFAENALFTVLVDFAGNNIPMESTVWLGLEFDKLGAGWVVGTPATVGFTENIYQHPNFPCFASFTVFYSGFHAKVFCSDTPPFDREFLAYLNPELDAPTFIPGGNVWIADDVTLIVDDCILTSYEIGSVGNSPYTVTAEIWNSCGPTTVIEGTQGIFSSEGSGTPELARFSFPEGIPLTNGDSYWVAWRYSNATAAIIAGEATLGFSDITFALFPPGGCNFWFGVGPQASFNLTIRCLGEPPVGACCSRALDNVCSVTQEIGCSGLGDEWKKGAICDPDPFDAPCGTLACCLPDPPPRGGCENLTPEECASRGGFVRPNFTCGTAPNDCPWFPCRQAQGDCCLPGDEVACNSISCCTNVCNVDEWCCAVEWDWICAWEAGQFCGSSCPDGPVALVDPPDGVIDARQPHAIGDASEAQGIDTILVQVPEGASPCCWSICEPIARDIPNHITAMTHHGDGTATIRLAFPIAAPGTTTLRYDRDGPGGTTLSIKTHPGDVNGDQLANPADILALIDGLTGVVTLPWGIYSCDLDRSGMCGPADILRVIDLLNGAGAFEPWLDTPFPPSDCP